MNEVPRLLVHHATLESSLAAASTECSLVLAATTAGEAPPGKEILEFSPNGNTKILVQTCQSSYVDVEIIEEKKCNNALEGVSLKTHCTLRFHHLAELEPRSKKAMVAN